MHAGGKSSKVMVVAILVVCYSLCSSMLLILNKVRGLAALGAPLALHVSEPYSSGSSTE